MNTNGHVSFTQRKSFSFALLTPLAAARYLSYYCFSNRLAVFIALLFLLPICSTFSQTVQYSYDAMGRLTHFSNPDGSRIDYVYDALGNRLIQSTSVSGSPSDQPPSAVSNTGIANGATNVTLTPALSWSPSVDTNSNDAVVYYIYFGTSPNPPLAFSGWSTNWSPGRLQGLTTYYWYVVARDSQNQQTASPIWSFTTLYIPPVAAFSASATNGSALFTVSFYDHSSCIDDTIISWAWDFNGDGIVDSTAQNPTYTYSAGGNYTVSLTVRAQNPAGIATVTMTNFISVLGSNIVDLAPTTLNVNVAQSYRLLQVQYTITNMGTINVSAPWSYADVFYVSTNSVLDASATQVAVFYENQPLPPNSSYSRTNQVTIPIGVGHNYYLLLKTDGNNQIAEINESNNVIAIPLDGHLPDLVPGNISLAGNPVSGESLQVIYTATNSGALPISAQWIDKVYLSTNSVLDTNAISCGSLTLNQSLAVGGTYTATNVVTLPRIPVGTYNLLLHLDDTDQIVESNETNNTGTIPVVLTIPDLVPSSFALVGLNGSGLTNLTSAAGPLPQSAHPYTNSSDISWTNTVPGADVLLVSFDPQTFVESCCDRIYVMDGNGNQIPGSPFAGGTLAGQTVLVPGNTVVLRLTSDSSVTYWGFAVTSLMGGNLTGGPVSVTATKPNPVVNAIWKVGNNGNGAAQGSWVDSVYFSTNGTLTQSTDLLNTAESSVTVGVGGSYGGSGALTVPVSQSGTSYLILDVNQNNGLYEVNTNNNTLSVPFTFTLTPPDLVPTSLAVVGFDGSGLTNLTSAAGPLPQSTHPYTNNSNISWTNTVPGADVLLVTFDPQTFVESCCDRIYVMDGSSNQIPGSPFAGGTLAGQTVLVPGNTVVLRLTSDGSDTYWGFAVDQLQGGQIAGGPVTVTATKPNPAVNVFWRVGNTGNGAAQGSWVDSVYFSTNGTLAQSTNLLNSTESSVTVGSGGNYSSSGVVTVPVSQSGTSYLIFDANQNNGLYEANTNNNTLSLPLTFNLTPPDLVPLSLASISAGISGSSVNLRYSVTNIGIGPAMSSSGYWQDRVTLSTNSTLAGAITSWTWNYTGTLAAGSSYTLTNSALLSSALPSGTYYLILQTDIGNQVFESNETNNTLAAVSLTVVAPLMQNGGFETGNFSGWLQSGNTSGASVTTSSTYVHSGQYGAELGPVGSLGYLSQTITTIPGAAYLVSCWLNSQGGTPNEFVVSWNGTNLFDQTNIGVTGWTNLQFAVSATATNTILKFGFRNDPGELGLDDISVTEISVPPVSLSSIGFSPNGGFQLSVSAQVGQSYTLQASTNLVNWISILNFTCTNSLMNVVDQQAKNYNRRFYRLAQGTLLVPVSPVVLGFGSSQPWSANGLSLMLQGPIGSNYQIQASTDLLEWLPITNFVITNAPFYFNDPASTNYIRRFYRAVIP